VDRGEGDERGGGIPDELIAGSADSIDLTEGGDRRRLLDLAERVLAHPALADADLRVLPGRETAPLELRVALKLADSRRFLHSRQPRLRVAVVYGMWGEQNRLRPKTAQNPNGEDALRVKLDQLAWACEGTGIHWTLVAVDDGCPHDSGGLAEEMAGRHPLGDRVRVLRLADHLPAKAGPLAGLVSADDSRKGGALICGATRALDDGAEVVVVTDADSSVHLGQLGLLLRPYLERGTRVVLGTRKHPEAVLVKEEGRWGVGIKLLRHMQRSVGHAIFSRGILDTQAAFKLFQSDLLREILEAPTVFDFSIDTDWIAAVLARNEAFEIVPFAFIDSFAESASISQGPMTTWETLLKGLVKQVRARGLPHDEAMARVLDEEIHTAADLDLLIHQLPPELEAAEGDALGAEGVMSPEAVGAWIRRQKRATGAT